VSIFERSNGKTLSIAHQQTELLMESYRSVSDELDIHGSSGEAVRRDNNLQNDRTTTVRPNRAVSGRLESGPSRLESRPRPAPAAVIGCGESMPSADLRLTGERMIELRVDSKVMDEADRDIAANQSSIERLNPNGLILPSQFNQS